MYNLYIFLAYYWRTLLLFPVFLNITASNGWSFALVYNSKGRLKFGWDDHEKEVFSFSQKLADMLALNGSFCSWYHFTSMITFSTRLLYFLNTSVIMVVPVVTMVLCVVAAVSSWWGDESSGQLLLQKCCTQWCQQLIDFPCSGCSCNN